MQRAIVAVVLMSGLTLGANAADLPSRMPAANAPFSAPVFAAWSGFYVGVNAGYHFGDREAQTSSEPPGGTVPAALRRVGLDSGGIIGGGQIGYNWQFGSWVTGVEADIQASGINDESAVSFGAGPGALRAMFSQDMEWLGTVRGRLGYAMDRTLIFATGGFAYGKVENSVVVRSPVIGLVVSGRDRSVETGYTVGAGIEHAFGTNWSAKLEYLYYDLGDTTTALSLAFPPGSHVANARFENDGHIVRVGLNYKF